MRPRYVSSNRKLHHTDHTKGDDSLFVLADSTQQLTVILSPLFVKSPKKQKNYAGELCVTEEIWQKQTPKNALLMRRRKLKL